MLTSLNALSPLDGRYREKIASLCPILSESGFIYYRLLVEIRWLLALLQEKTLPDLPPLTPNAVQKLEQMATQFSERDAITIKSIEKKTNHDVKAIEYFLRDHCQKDPALSAYIPFIHFGCTSEDINNIAYALMLTRARDTVLLPALQQILNTWQQMAAAHAEQSMLSRTHGQPASPTTVGKEFANFIARLIPLCRAFKAFKLPAKMNGAVGNFNAHVVAYPEVDWPGISQRFITSLDLAYSEYTTQIEPHDALAEWLHILIRLNHVLIDYCRDMWGYISMDYFQQKMVATEVGSSTMPHKINPIDFENAEGNLGIANALATHMTNKLPISRWQRDLSDSTVMRNLGSVLGYSLIAYQALEQGQHKIAINTTRLQSDLLNHGEVLAEAVQTVLRRYGINEAYEQLKSLTRGQSFDAKAFLAFIDQLPLPVAEKNKLRTLTPDHYVGCAVTLAKKISRSMI